MKLTAKLPLIVVGSILVTAIAGSALAIAFGRHYLREATLDDNLHGAEMYASGLLSYVGGARSLLATTAALPQLRNSAQPRELAALMLAQSNVFEYLMLLKPDGTVEMLEPRALEQKLSHRNMSFNAWFGEVRQAKGSVVSDLHISPATQRPAIVIATPVRTTDGRTLGIWAGALNLEKFSKISAFAPDSARKKESGFVTDRRGLIIAHQTRPDLVENQTDFSTVPSVREALAGRKGTSENFNAIENIQNLSGYLALPELGWAVVFRVPVGVALAPADELTRVILAASLALAALFGAGVFFATRRTVAPLAELTAVTQRVGAGEFGHRLEVISGDEIGQLSDAFNRMTAAIAEKDTLLRTRAAELARSNTELEQFAYIASHDLQEPLRMVVGYVQLLEKRLGGTLEADTREFMGYAVDGALRMQNLIEDILEYSRVSSQAQPLAPVDSAVALKEALDRLAGRIAESRAKIEVQPLPVVMADQAQLVQLFQNLISNAIKFCKEPAPYVRVDAVQAAGRWRFSVTDNGIGIAPEFRGRLFVIFKRLHGRSEYSGTGIGLAICKRIVEHHGGEIGIESAPEGGSAFWFTLENRTAS